MKKLVLFDFDGTLADSAPDLAAAANKARARKGLDPLPYDALRHMASQGARGMLKASLDINPDDPGYESLRLQFLQDYERDMTTRTTLFPGIPELFATLEKNGHRWGIVTNKVEYLTLPLAQHLGLQQRCAVIVSGDTTGNRKPHPAPLLYAAEKVGFAADDCLYIGDDERDIQAGKAAGMGTIAAAYGYCGTTEVTHWNADAIASSPHQLWPAIERLCCAR